MEPNSQTGWISTILILPQFCARYTRTYVSTLTDSLYSCRVYFILTSNFISNKFFLRQCFDETWFVNWKLLFEIVCLFVFVIDFEFNKANKWQVCLIYYQTYHAEIFVCLVSERIIYTNYTSTTNTFKKI